MPADKRQCGPTALFARFRDASNPNIWVRRGSEASEERKLAAACVAVAIAPCHKLDVMPSADQRFKMKWWGWGSDEIRKELPHSAATRDYLRAKLGIDQFAPRSEFKLQSLQLPESRADQSLVARLGAIVGAEHCRTDHRERALHSLGKSYKDLLRIRQLVLERAPDAVVYPRSEAEVAAVLACCRELQAAVVPFGGGTSVVGGVEPEAGGAARRRDDRPGLAQSRAGNRRGLPNGDGRGGNLRPRTGIAVGRTGLHAGALSAVVRVLHARRLDRHPLERPKLAGLRRHRKTCRKCPRRDTAGDSRNASRPPPRRRSRRRPDADWFGGSLWCDRLGDGADSPSAG